MSNSIRVKTTVNNVYDKLVELSSSLENDVTVTEISDDKGSFEIKFGDMLNGFKYLVVSAFKNGDVVLVQTETYAKNPLMGIKQPVPIFQRKSANKFAQQVLDYLNEVTEEKTETVAEVKEKKVVKVNEIKKESKEKVAEAIKEDTSKNKSKSLVLLVSTIFIAVIGFFALMPDKYSVCECQPVVGTSSYFQSQQEKINWCERKYRGYSQRDLIYECKNEIRKNM